MFQSDFVIIFLLLAAGAIVSYVKAKLTAIGAVAGFMVSIIIFTGTKLTGLSLMAIFFLLANFATAFNKKKKQLLQLEEANAGRRNASQVLANAGVAAFVALIAIVSEMFHQSVPVALLLVAAAFSSATADTLSSEMGNIYGRNFYNILTFKKDTRGLDGVISLEGSLCGLLGSIIIAGVYFAASLNTTHAVIIVIAGTIGNLADSVIGASLERKQLMGNNMVNFLNTLIGAGAAFLLYWLFK